MANEIMFPLRECPSFERLLDVIVDGFNDLSLSTQQLTIGVSAKKSINLSGRFLFIQDHKYEYFCWVSFSYFELEARDEDNIDWPIMVGVSTRGEMSRKFSVIVTYLLAKSLAARIIYDDSYLVQRKNYYPIDELKPFVDRYIKELYPSTN